MVKEPLFLFPLGSFIKNLSFSFQYNVLSSSVVEPVQSWPAPVPASSSNTSLSKNRVLKTRVNNFFFFKCTLFLFNLCINCQNVTKFYKNCRYFATTVPLSQTATAQSRSFFTGSSSSWKFRLRLHNTADKEPLFLFTLGSFIKNSLTFLPAQ